MAASFVVPGEQILTESDYLQGHGTYINELAEGAQLIASIAGDIHRIDKLISVHPQHSRSVVPTLSYSPY
jgi:exosome complex RNA-binding protein Rrp4